MVKGKKKKLKSNSWSEEPSQDKDDLDYDLNLISSKFNKKLDKEFDRFSEIDSKRFRERKKRKSEDSSTVEGVLDLSTSKEIYKLQKQQVLKGLGGIISTGKESNVYYTRSKNLELTKNINELAVKVYRTRTLNFRKIKKYIEGDIRFSKIGNKSHQIIQTWALKEFKNLSRAFDSNLPVPEPITVRRNILVMEFIGENGIAAPQLRHITKFNNEKEIETYYAQALKILDDLWNKINLVHGDFSSYNILIKDEKLYAIDMGQGVLKEHYLAKGFLWRDIKNILYYFSNFNIELDEPETVYEQITGKKAIPEFLKI